MLAKGILRLFLQLLTQLLAIALGTFLLSDYLPGDLLTGLQSNAGFDEKMMERLRMQLQLDQPWWQRFAGWLGSVLRGDFGQSLAFGVAVREMTSQLWENTLWLNLGATLFAWTAALPLGTVAALHAQGRVDDVVRGGQALLLSVPEVLLAFVGLRYFHWFLPMPYLVLGLAALPVLTIHIRNSLVAALADPSVEAARALGIGPVRLWWSYVLPLTAGTLLPLAGLSFGGLLSASILTEGALSVPGLGGLLVNAIYHRDTPVVASLMGLAAIFVLVANFVAEALRLLLDRRPRGLS